MSNYKKQMQKLMAWNATARMVVRARNAYIKMVEYPATSYFEGEYNGLMIALCEVLELSTGSPERTDFYTGFERETKEILGC